MTLGSMTHQATWHNRWHDTPGTPGAWHTSWHYTPGDMIY